MKKGAQMREMWRGVRCPWYNRFVTAITLPASVKVPLMVASSEVTKSRRITKKKMNKKILNLK